MEEREQEKTAVGQPEVSTLQQKLRGACRRLLTHKALLRIGRVLRKYALPFGAITISVAILLLSAALVFSAAICDRADERIVTVEALANVKADYILVLGCAVYEGGRLSDMLADRVSVGAELYHAGVADTVLMSGDGGSVEGYNEVIPMQNAAIALGVEESNIVLDPNGFSTYESIENLFREHGRCRVVIVSQDFHLHRAIYLAEKMGLDAYGVGADLREYRDEGRLRLREILARCKDMVQVQITRSKEQE